MLIYQHIFIVQKSYPQIYPHNVDKIKDTDKIASAFQPESIRFSLVIFIIPCETNRIITDLQYYVN